MSKLSDILNEIFRVKENDYTDATELMQFKEWDSMAHMLFITRIEEDYAIQLTGDEIAMMRTVGQLKEVLKKHGVQEL